MLIHETSHWILKHRADSKLPGYLILQAKSPHADSLSKLSCNSINELGLLQAQATGFLETRLGARLVYICRFGHQPGNAPHFHIVPFYDWVEKAYQADPIWVAFEPEPDGPVYFTYITRAFIEYEKPPVIEGPTIDMAVQALRQDFAKFYNKENIEELI